MQKNESNFQNDVGYLHYINGNDITQVLKFLPGGGGYATPASLDILFLVENNADFNRINTAKIQKKFYHFSEDDLRFNLHNIVEIDKSPRMEILIAASKFRSGKKIGKMKGVVGQPFVDNEGRTLYKLDIAWSNQVLGKEEEIIRKSEVEIEFELGRRQYSNESPSRITCLFMVEDTIDGRLVLANMFGENKKDYLPILLELVPLRIDRITKVDSRWYELYLKEKDKKEYIENYWIGKASDNPLWEILFEGMVTLKNVEQRVELQEILNKYIGKK